MTWIGIYMYLILPVLRPHKHLQNPGNWAVDFDPVNSCYIFTIYKFSFFYICFLKTVWEIVFQLFRPLYITHDNELNSFLVFYALFFNKSLEDLDIIERRREHCEHLGEMEIKQNLQRLYLFEDSQRILS